LAKPSDVVYAFHRLLDLRAQAKLGKGQGQGQGWTPDAAVLEVLVRQAVGLTKKVAEQQQQQQQQQGAAEGKEGVDEALRAAQASLLKQVRISVCVWLTTHD
jgi:hypothetical protein